MSSHEDQIVMLEQGKYLVATDISIGAGEMIVMGGHDDCGDPTHQDGSHQVVILAFYDSHGQSQVISIPLESKLLKKWLSLEIYNEIKAVATS